MKMYKYKDNIIKCLNSKLDFINEFILCERRSKDYSSYMSDLPDEEDANAANMYRRVLCILLYLLNQKNNIAGLKIDFEKKEYVGFNPENYPFCHEDDEVYISAMEDFLSFYGWSFPVGWNTDFCFMTNEVDDEDFAEIYFEKEGVDYREEYGFTHPITLHNALFDKVHNIELDTKKYSKEDIETAASEYSEIWTLVQSVTFDSICHYKTMIDTYFVDEKVYFTMLVSDCMDIYEAVHNIDFHRFLNPLLLFTVPKLDKMMKDYICKWENKK